MKILTIVGKVDSRPLVYPLARGLSMAGLTGIVTDDGAYRRLFHGKGDMGVVSGVDVGICSHVDEKTVHMLDKSGIPYDYLIVVSNDYIPLNSTGALLCHGLDRSMLVVDDEEVDADEEFFFMLKKKMEAAKAEENTEATEGKKPKKGKKAAEEPKVEEVKVEEPAIVESVETTESDGAENSDETIADVETLHDKLIRLQQENPDKIIVPAGMKTEELQIAFAPAPKKGMAGLALKDGLMQYVYNCEETKQIALGGKEVNALLCKLIPGLLDIDAKEFSVFLMKEEGKGAPDTGKKKKK